MKKEDRRFKVVYKQGGLQEIKILVDMETGVNYLFYAGGLSPLLDRDGKPVVTTVTEQE